MLCTPLTLETEREEDRAWDQKIEMGGRMFAAKRSNVVPLVQGAGFFAEMDMTPCLDGLYRSFSHRSLSTLHS